MVVSLRRAALVLCLVLAALAVGGAPARAACTDVAAPKVDWRRCTLDAGDYANRNLSGAELRDASFNFSNLAGADLTDADAYHGKFLSTNLKGARLDRATLSEADFTRADLTGASLVRADLRRARFFRANLRDADFTGAQMGGADLLNADLSGALWLDGKRRCGAGSIGQCN
jgi:uncharacterized protein YjbI with pentapeptide repeats